MRQVRFGPALTGAVKNIILLNTFIYLADLLLHILFNSNFIMYYFALRPGFIVNDFFIWQIFTYSFLHGGFFHLFFNMITLWMFGSELEMRWGEKKFVKFYLATGIITGVIIFMFNYLAGVSNPTVGASGVIFAILLIYAFYWGDRMLYFWGIIPIRVKYFVMFIAVFSFLAMITPGASNISHIGHIGGLIAGYLYFKLVLKETTSISFDGAVSSIVQKIKMYEKKRQWERKGADNFNRMSDEERVDAILKKISLKGIRSLTRQEREFLKETSDRMNGKNPH